MRTPEQAVLAHEAGARFVISPGFNPRVVETCLERGIPVYPGVCTPTEIEAALECDLRVLKFSPTEPIGGVKYLKAISAPFAEVEFIPTGGITPGRLGDYLAFGKVLACGGSWLTPAEWIRAKRFEQIREEAESAVRLTREWPRGG